jgi:hypothetical protein
MDFCLIAKNRQAESEEDSIGGGIIISTANQRCTSQERSIRSNSNLPDIFVLRSVPSEKETLGVPRFLPWSFVLWYGCGILARQFSGSDTSHHRFPKFSNFAESVHSHMVD